MTSIKKTFCFILIFFLYVATFASEPYIFKSGLVLPFSHSYGRTAWYTDQIAFKMNNGTLQQPAENSVVFKNFRNEDVSWSAIEADEEGRFRNRSFGGGYMYLTYSSPKEQQALLFITSNNMVYVNGEPRTGDSNGAGNVYLPIKLKKGLNEFYVRCGRFSGVAAKLIFDKEPVFLNVEDPTIPIIVAKNNNNDKIGAVVVVNNTNKVQSDLQIKCTISGKSKTTSLPAILPMSIRKVRFDFDASTINSKGDYSANLELLQKGKEINTSEVKISAVNPDEDYTETFVSEIDGSVQYYAVSPQLAGGNAQEKPALFFSVHGAGVEAINQARAYKSKEEGVLVAPTNRRPRGFNWEDWGRLDALEVLGIAKKQFAVDPQRIYLTGHSMGGHGTWFLGATYAGQWAAIAPCAGYPTLMGYGSADGPIPSSGRNPEENLLLQASNPSNVIELNWNYNSGGVYIFHGDDDRTVSVNFARQMHELLSKSSKDICYYEYPGGSHWFGDESVDWKPIFDYFKWHYIPKLTDVLSINFTTANPAISSIHSWVSVLQQKEALKYSRVKLTRTKDLKAITGTTENISLLSFSLEGLQNGDLLKITLDGTELQYNVASDVLYLRRAESGWKEDKAPGDEKNASRNGTFKEPFNHRMVYVYGTSGSKEENAWAFNKARYDAESWYYRGNGAVDVIADKDFNPANYPDRGIILIGNAATNSAWKTLLRDCPIEVTNGKIQVGEKVHSGTNIGAYFMWPRPDSKIAGIAVISGSGIEGMKAVDANQYFTGGSGFPDYMVFSSEMLLDSSKGILDVGFYSNDWSMQNGQRVTK